MQIETQAETILNPFDEAREAFDAVVRQLGSMRAHEWTHSEAERFIESEGREVMRRLYQGFLDSQGPGVAKGPVLDAVGTRLEYRRLRDRRVMSIFGPVELTRTGYYTPEASVVYPLDAELNLPPESYSFETQRRTALEIARGSFDGAVAAMKRNTGANVPKRQAEGLVVRAVEDFDGFYRERALSPEAGAGDVVVISVDGKGVVVRTEDLREATRKAASERLPKLARKLSKGEKRNAKRMATVAAVYSIDRFVRRPEDVMGELRRVRAVKRRRPRPRGKRVWASLAKEPQEVVTGAFEEALRRDPARKKPWVVVVDGSDAQLRLIKRCAKRFGVKVTIVLDIMHVLGYLWGAAHELTVEGTPHSEKWVLERALRILGGEAGTVAGAMRRSATKRGLGPRQRAAVDRCANYLLKHRRFLKYGDYLRQGFPIASGVVEGACRHLINDRLDITGARWSLARAEAVLRVRALLANDDFDTYWVLHECCEYERNHARWYGGSAPRTSRPSRRATRLRLVK
jgi:hypothetical protein